jgi:hypothetical protein
MASSRALGQTKELISKSKVSIMQFMKIINDLQMGRGAEVRIRFNRVCVVVVPLVLLAVFLTGCGTTKVTGEQPLADVAAAKPSVVYVADFGLLPGEIEDDKGVLSHVPIISKPAKELLYGQRPPEERARELIELMSTSLVKDIEKKGMSAVRFDHENPVPTNGWMVRGIYTKVQEGNQLRRSLVGFGVGKTDVQVVTVFDDLSAGPPQPIYQMDTDANSGRLPGTAPLVVLSPYATAARFILSGADLDRSVRETARKINASLVQEIEAAH